MAEMNESNRDLKSEDSNLIVVLRIRPMMDDEIYQGATPIAHCVDDNLVVLMDPMDETEDVLRQNRSREKQFMFDMVFDAKATQVDVYRKTCKFLIPSVINGFNATVFAYGATGAGKTFTMLGRDDSPGIMAQALTELFYEMNKNDELIYKVSMSYLEIYNEMIRDLLNPGSGYLDLREDAKGVQVAGLSEHSARSTAEVMAILKEGNKQRTQEPTAANKTSSRSHAVLIISVRQRSRVDGIHQHLRVGKLFLIDLAGSERAANTQNRGKRMVEGAHINRSLLALGNCINALSDKNGSKYINYRDSKLTRLLKDALGGNCKTVMIAHISPANFFFEESRNTLSYADRAKSIRTKVRQNVLDMTLHISQYSNIISDLRDEIKRLKTKLDQQQQTTTVHAIQSEVMRRGDDVEFTRLKNELQNVFQSQTELKENLIELNKSESEMNIESTKLQLQLTRLKQDQLLKSDSILSRLDEITESKDVVPYNPSKVKKELETLASEKDAIEHQKADVERKLENIKNKTIKLQEELSRLSNSPDQKEILFLLGKIQTLERENTQLQTHLLIKMNDVKRRDLLISLQDHQQMIGNELMKQQKSLIRSNTDVVAEKNVSRLETVYENERKDVESHRATLLPSLSYNNKMFSQPLSSLPEASVSTTDNNNHHLPRLFERVEPSKRMKTYVNSIARAGSRNQQQRSHRSNSSSPPNVTTNMTTKQNYSPTIEDLILENEDKRSQMTNATHNIAILATRRKNKTTARQNHYDQYRRRDRGGGDGVFHLTESRLAQHDRRYNANGTRSNATLTTLTMSDKHSTSTNESNRNAMMMKQNEKTTTSSLVQPTTTFYDRTKANKNKSHLKKEVTINRRILKPHGVSIVTEPTTTSSSSNAAADKDSILKRLRNLKEPTDYDLPATAAAAGPSISSYRKGDMSVTGYGLQQ